MTFLFNIILGWLLNTTLECRWFWIRFQFSITVFLKLGRAKRYCVPKGNIFFRVLFSLFLSDLSLPVILASEIYLSKISSRYPLIFKCISVCFYYIWEIFSSYSKNVIELVHIRNCNYVIFHNTGPLWIYGINQSR